MDAGDKIERICSRQIEDVSKNSYLVDVTLTVLQPKASEIYYGACSKIDRHNRCQQEFLDIEKKLQTHEWDKRSNLGILEICVLDDWMCYSIATKVEETQETYYSKISEEMIDNLLDANLVTRRRKRGDKTRDVMTIPKPLISDDGRQNKFTGIHVTPIRRSKGGKN